MSDRFHFIEIKSNPSYQNFGTKSNVEKPVDAIERQPHHKVRHGDEAKKSPKHSLDDYVILNILNEQCECKTPCYHNFSVLEVKSIRKQFDYSQDGDENTENEMYASLLNYLDSHSVLEKTPGSHKIGGKFYCLKFMCHPGVFLCPTAFCRIIGVSVKKLRIAANHNSEYGTELVDPIPEDRVKFAPKADSIVSFLEHVKLKLTHQVKSVRKDGSMFEYDSIIGFHEPKDLFNFYLSMLDANFIPPSYDWFHKVWKDRYPNLYTSKDRPCIACNEFTHNIREYVKKGDQASVKAERSRMEDHISMSSPPPGPTVIFINHCREGQGY